MSLETTVGEAVLGTCLFGRPGPVTDDPVAELIAAKLAGGLPARFVLVLTPTRLLAYAPELDAELAAWPRAGLAARSARSGTVVKVVLERAEQRVAMEAPVSAVTDAFLRALEG
jgi:hypothetical protein